MKELVDKFVELERKISDTKGDFALFALFLREDAIDKWDLLVAAPWIEVNRKTALAYITEQIQSSFEPTELAQLSRVVLIDQANPALDAINRAAKTEHVVADVQDSNFFGLQIKHALIITAQGQKMNVAMSAS